MDINNNNPPIYKQLLWVKYLPDVFIETQVIYVLLEDHSDIDILQTQYSMWTYDGAWHLLNGIFNGAIQITFEQYKTLITNNALVVGQQYLIEAFEFTYEIGGTDVEAMYTESLLVTALTTNTLLPIAYPIGYPNDWVEVDWSIPAIIFRHDTLLNNHIGYDYRNKLNRRYKLNVTNLFVPSTTFTDWFLPSIDALVAINTLLVANNITSYPIISYWSSSEDITDPLNRAHCLKLDGVSTPGIAVKNTTLGVLPIRSFTNISEVQTYQIGDIGPAKGFIFEVINNLDGSFTYYEVSNTPIDSEVWCDVLEWRHTDVGIVESETNTTLIIDTVGSIASAALTCTEYSYSVGYSIGDIVVDQFDRIYIAVKDNNSISLDDGNWFLYPVSNGTYNGGDYNFNFDGLVTSVIVPYDEDDYKDILTINNTEYNITTGANFINNICTNSNNLKFESNVKTNIILACSYLDIKIIDSSIIIYCSYMQIGSNNSKYFILGSSYITIDSNINNIMLPPGSSNINIGSHCNNLLSTLPLNNVTFGSSCTNLLSTSNINNIHIKDNINLSNLTEEVITILGQQFFKTIELMYDSVDDYKAMLYYFDANSSLPILIEIQEGD